MPPPTMIRLGQTAIFLRGFDQASPIAVADLQKGAKLTIHPDRGNVHDACAVAVENRHGQCLGRVARERSKECFQLLRRIKSTNFKITATFSQLATKFGKYCKSSKSTAVRIQLQYSICRGDYGDVRQKREELRNLVEQCNILFTSSNLAERETSSNLAERLEEVSLLARLEEVKRRLHCSTRLRNSSCFWRTTI